LKKEQVTLVRQNWFCAANYNQNW